MRKTAKTSDFSDSCPYIDICINSDNMLVSDAAFRLIGNPDAVRFWTNPETKTLVIQPVDADAPHGINVEQYVCENYDCFQSEILGVFHTVMPDDLDWSKHYRVIAKHNVLSNVAIFDLKEAIYVTD
ncbi:MAG: hypothetical protein FWC10_11090 [Lentimicrobiaceae bacterium]|nr:hypothetical protein [Lentimicrobiaceae bacterium]